MELILQAFLWDSGPDPLSREMCPSGRVAWLDVVWVAGREVVGDFFRMDCLVVFNLN